MWKDATILGLGVSQLSNGAYVVVGRYSGEPGTVLGNMAGRFPDNVLPLRGPNYKPKVSERVKTRMLNTQFSRQKSCL